MKPSHLHRWIAWLLPLLVLRAFVPVGFMLTPSADGLQMVLCAGTGPAAMPAQPHAASTEHEDPAAHAGHAHHAHGATANSSHHHSPTHQSSMCVFAVGGTANAPPTQIAPSLDVPAVDSPIDFHVDPELTSLPTLIDRIRGPPSA